MIAVKGLDQPWAIELHLEDSRSVGNRTQSGYQLVIEIKIDMEQELSREPRTEARLSFPDQVSTGRIQTRCGELRLG